MAAPIPIALLGFSSFERNALASYFRVAAQRSPSYVHVLDVDEARYVVADADQPGVPQLLQTLGRTADAVFIGAQSPPGAAGWMMRPIDPVQVLRELDQLLALGDAPASRPPDFMVTSPPPLARGSVSAPTPFGRSSMPAPLDMPSRRADDDPSHRATISAADRRAASEARRQARDAVLRPKPLRRALLVDDSELALHFLDRQLQAYGISTEWAHNSGKALELLSHESFGFVFLDIDLGELSDLDGLALCQHIKHRHVFADQRKPVVALVSAFHDPVDRVRGTLAGADAHLGKPLDLNALDDFLRNQGLWRMAQAADGPPASGDAPPAS